MEYGRADLNEYLSGAAAHYLGYDLRRLWVRPYHNSAGHTLTAELYDLSSPEEAYGVLSWDWAGEPLDIAGAEGFYTQGALRLRKGRCYLWIISSTQDDRYRDDLLALAEGVADSLPQGLAIPRLVERLPKQGMNKNTVFYFHTKESLDSKVSLGKDNLLQLSRKTNGVLASYKLPEGEGNLLLVEYPREEAARASYSFLKGYFRKTALTEGPPGTFIGQTKSEVYEGVTQVGTLVAVALNGEKEEVCRRLLAEAAELGG
jgi:hypothetical protein